MLWPLELRGPEEFDMGETELIEAGGVRLATLSAEGPPLGNERDASDLIGSLHGSEAQLIAIPVERLDPRFFQLATGLAGAFVQKFVTYGLRLAVVGDIGAFVNRSEALRAFVKESNRGRHLWFVADRNELVERLELMQKGRD
jgi:hypothetical protein